MTDLVRARGIVAVSQSVQGRKRGLSVSQVNADLRKVKATGAGVVALQGMGRWKDWLALRGTWDWEQWDRWPRFPWDKGSGEPILWDTNLFRFRDGYTRILHDAVHGLTPLRHINYVLLEDIKSGICFWVRNTEYVESHMHHKEVDQKRVSTWLDGNANDRMYLREAMTTGDPVLSFGMYHRISHAVIGTYQNDHLQRYVGRQQSDYSILTANDKGSWYVAGQAILPWTEFHSHHTGRLLRLNIIRMGAGK